MQRKYLAWTRLSVVSLSEMVLGCRAVVDNLLVVVLLVVVVVGLLVVVVVVVVGLLVVVLLVVVVVLEVWLFPFNLLSAVRQDSLQGYFSSAP